MHPQGDQEELLLPVHVGELPAELGIVGVIVAHAPRVVEIFFFFSFNKRTFHFTGVPLVTEVALPLTLAL